VAAGELPSRRRPSIRRHSRPPVESFSFPGGFLRRSRRT
jgi:hypothetical protein